MITVKVFDENLRCRGFQYEVNKEYEIPIDEVEMCKGGFHASAHCDISETTFYYPNVLETRYCLVDINVVEEDDDVVVGDKIKILKELDFDECIKYDKTGGWCYDFVIKFKDKNNKESKNIIKKLENAIIEKDKTGELCYLFAFNVKSADIKRLEDAIIEKDKTGQYCYYFAEDIKGADIKRLENAVIKKDTTGFWCYKFAKDIIGVNVERLEKTVIERDKTGQYYYLFTENIKKINKIFI